MSVRSRRNAIVVALLGSIALGSLLFWQCDARRKPQHLGVVLKASRPSTGPFGRIGLEATATGGGQVAWDASGGRLLGRGLHRTWLAPQEPGTYTVTVTTARADQPPASASVRLLVLRFEPNAEPGADRPGTARSPTEGGAYTIGEVRFDKAKMCSNEDVRIHVEASDPAGDSAWLEPRIIVGGLATTGFDAIGRVGREALDDPGTAWGAQKIKVQLFDTRDARIVAEKEVPFQIDDCQAPGAGMVLYCQPGKLLAGQVSCKMVAPSGFVPVAWHWELGVRADGQVDERRDTPADTIDWVVPPGVEEGVFSSIIVSGTATDASGLARSGRASFIMTNTFWEVAQRSGMLTLNIRNEAYARSSGGTQSVEVTVVNPFKEAIALDDVSLASVPCAQRRNLVPSGQTTALAIMKRDVIQPGERFTFTWTLPADARRCAAEADVHGQGLDSGLPAMGHWVMMSDPALVQAPSEVDMVRVQRAIQILSKRRGQRVRRIEEAELMALEKEGLIPPAGMPPPPADLPADEPGPAPEMPSLVP